MFIMNITTTITDKNNIKRPLFLSIISIIQALLAPLYFIFLISQPTEMPIGVIISYNTFLIFPVSSYGLWKQRKWGWWIGVILYGGIIWGNIIRIIHVLIIMHGIGRNEMDFYWQEIISQIPILFLLLIVFGYMFSSKVLDYYNLKIKTSKLLLMVIGLSLLIHYLIHWLIVLPLS